MPFVPLPYALIKKKKKNEEWKGKRKLGPILAKNRLDFLGVYLAQCYFHRSFKILQMVFFIAIFQANSVKHRKLLNMLK